MIKKRPNFKPYNQQQGLLLPLNLIDLVPSNHPCRVVNDIIDKIDLTTLLASYKNAGCSSYHPKMLLKLLVYGYISNIYSSRKLESSCKESVYFMWLTSMNKPDHHTINRFRGERLKGNLQEIFNQVVQLLASEGLLSIEEVYTDGTKIESASNKYKFVWKKSIQTNKEKMKQQLHTIWQYAQSVATEEDALPEPPDFTTIDKEKVQAAVDTLNAVLHNKQDVDKKIKQKLCYVTKNYPANIAKYEQQEVILGERNSYSKTDEDATFMRMKEDHMGNGQLKPGYNVQISTSNQYIVNYTIHPNQTDTTTLAAHLTAHKESYGSYPKILTADAGYGSEENYTMLEKENVTAYVKYSLFDKQQHEVYNSKHPFTADKLHYNEEQDIYICPMGQAMQNIGTYNRKSTTGFEQTLTRYQAKNCATCPLKGACHKSIGNRVIEINKNLNQHKQNAFDLLHSETGIAHRKKRCYDVEPVFGNIKQNHNFRRFMLRGKEKVSIEWGLIAIAQNLRKKAA